MEKNIRIKTLLADAIYFCPFLSSDQKVNWLEATKVISKEKAKSLLLSMARQNERNKLAGKIDISFFKKHEN